MRRYSVGSMLVVAAALAISPALWAQTPGRQGSGRDIPNLSGIWEVPIDSSPRPANTLLCGEGACRQLLGLPPPQQLSKNLEEPQMLPWAEEKYKSVREGIKDPNAFSNQRFNPSWGGCMPEGPTESTRRRGFELVQFPDVVLMLFDHDHAVRRIYIDGRPLPRDVKPTWMGYSVGKYDGDALVVETTGISDKAWIDVQGHPHSDSLRVSERIRRVDQNTLEDQLTFADPKTYNKPWVKSALHHLRPPGPNIWDSTECEELLQVGTHYSAESAR